LIAEERSFTILIERDEDGYYVAEVAELPGCHTQAKSMKELMKRIREAIQLYIEVGGKIKDLDVKRITINVPAKNPSL